MTLAPGRFDYAPITERPIIKWPGDARVAFWVAPNMEFFEYLPESRPTQPDIPTYARMDYGLKMATWNSASLAAYRRVNGADLIHARGFWRDEHGHPLRQREAVSRARWYSQNTLPATPRRFTSFPYRTEGTT